MEEETSEKNIMKKGKKLKKGNIFSPAIQNCSAENGSQAKTKKEKKWEKVGKEEEDETGQKEEKKKTKKKKKHDSVSIIVIDDDDDDDNKRKKKKLLEDNVNQVEKDYLKDENLEKKKRKEKKLKDKSVQIKSENIKKEEGKEIQIGNDDPPKKPKKEKGKMLDSSTAETEEMVGEKKGKKKKTLVITDGVGETKAKKTAKVVDNGMNVEKAETEVKEVKLKKKKEKESKTERFGNELKETEIQRKKKSTMDEKILRQKKDKLINKEIVTEEEKTEVKIKKKKKGKKEQEEDVKVEAEETEPKKKKKKVKVEEDEVEDEWSWEPNITPAAESKKSKKTKHSVKEDQDINNEAGRRKKRKVKEEQKDPQECHQVDVTFLSAKTGNTDEVSINPERRKALQMEIDKASQPDKPTGLGQWSTAQFDNSQQQQKFLRLMGGFKKGFQPAGTKAGEANMALGKEAQQQLQQGLLGEFERAHTRRMDFSNRGAGLGFSAPSNKKFNIDVNASRSVRFDD